MEEKNVARMAEIVSFLLSLYPLSTLRFGPLLSFIFYTQSTANHWAPIRVDGNCFSYIQDCSRTHTAVPNRK